MNTVDNVGELESGQPSMLVMLEIVVDEQSPAGSKVCCDEAANQDQLLLADMGPRCVADAQEDWL